MVRNTYWRNPLGVSFFETNSTINNIINMINYLNLHESTIFYEQKGFTRIEAPWTVTKAISEITKPKGTSDYSITEKSKVLVASGEQSFLYLYLKDFLPKGTFQTITPCFRNDLFDKTHTKYFMKNELIDTKDVSLKRLQEIIEICHSFFNKKLNDQVKVINTGKNTFDIEYKGVELGSYGIRSCEYLEWIYATGCAEPRLSYCQKLK